MNGYARAGRRWVRRHHREVLDARERVAMRWARFLLACEDEQVERHPAGRMFLRALPFALSRKFRSRNAVVEGEDLTAVIAMVITASDGVIHPLEISIARRRCAIRRKPVDDPDVSMALRLCDLIRMSSGAVDGPILMAAGRMKVAGDPFLLARFPGLFGLTTRALLQ